MPSEHPLTECRIVLKVLPEMQGWVMLLMHGADGEVAVARGGAPQCRSEPVWMGPKEPLGRLFPRLGRPLVRLDKPPGTLRCCVCNQVPRDCLCTAACSNCGASFCNPHWPGRRRGGGQGGGPVGGAPQRAPAAAVAA